MILEQFVDLIVILLGDHADAGSVLLIRQPEILLLRELQQHRVSLHLTVLLRKDLRRQTLRDQTLFLLLDESQSSIQRSV